MLAFRNLIGPRFAPNLCYCLFVHIMLERFLVFSTCCLASMFCALSSRLFARLKTCIHPPPEHFLSSIFSKTHTCPQGDRDHQWLQYYNGSSTQNGIHQFYLINILMKINRVDLLNKYANQTAGKSLLAHE